MAAPVQLDIFGFKTRKRTCIHKIGHIHNPYEKYIDAYLTENDGLTKDLISVANKNWKQDRAKCLESIEADVTDDDCQSGQFSSNSMPTTSVSYSVDQH